MIDSLWHLSTDGLWEVFALAPTPKHRYTAVIYTYTSTDVSTSNIGGESPRVTYGRVQEECSSESVWGGGVV